MGRRQLLELALLSGYVVALGPVLWARSDVSRIPRSVWRYAGMHPRSVWRSGLVVAYLIFGWPGLVVALAWRWSRDRASLREEWAHLHQRNVETRRRRTDPRRPDSRPDDRREEPRQEEPRPDEAEVVLADHEDPPESPDDPATPAIEHHEDASPG